ncbi:hypothetical protein MCC93_22260 [Morococcus cerebrosus]|uniref:Uncharacterized protein n=1 Tax=Morococcus cerebrosus TaxID=1056807 RepID=A0A0C1E3G8_9NEIS|nr:hypothetical protein MCC93_22260 [Morococcus cerebrosus]
MKFRNLFLNQDFSSFTMDSRLRGNDGKSIKNWEDRRYM